MPEGRGQVAGGRWGSSSATEENREGERERDRRSTGAKVEARGTTNGRGEADVGGEVRGKERPEVGERGERASKGGGVRRVQRGVEEGEESVVVTRWQSR